MFVWKALSMVFPLWAYVKYRRRLNHTKRIQTWTDRCMASQVVMSCLFHLSEAPCIPHRVYRILKISDMAMIHIQCVVLSRASSRRRPTAMPTVPELYIHTKAVQSIFRQEDHPYLRFTSYVSLCRPMVIRASKAQRARLLTYTATAFLLYQVNTDFMHVLFHVSLYKVYKHVILVLATAA